MTGCNMSQKAYVVTDCDGNVIFSKRSKEDVKEAVIDGIKIPLGYIANAAYYEYKLFNKYTVKEADYWQMVDIIETEKAEKEPTTEEDLFEEIMVKEIRPRYKYVKVIDNLGRIQCAGTIPMVAKALHVPESYIKADVESDVDIHGFLIERATYKEAQLYRWYCYLMAKHVKTNWRDASSMRRTKL